MSKQNPQGVKPCGAKTRTLQADGSPKLCMKPGTGAGGRCRYHGGASIGGASHPRFKHGRRSKYLVGGAQERYQDALADKRLLDIRQDVALIESLLNAEMAKLPAGRLHTEKQRRGIIELTEQRRRLISEEARRMVQLNQTVTLAQFMTTMRAVAGVIREFVVDEGQRRAVQARLQALLLPGAEAAGDAELVVAEGGDDGGNG
jgi:hypothetical protein